MNKVIPHPILGDILYKKNKRSKRVTIRVKEGGKVQVTLPYHACYQQAVQVVGSHLPWIEKQLQKSQKQQLEKSLDWTSTFSILEKKVHFKPYEGNTLKMEHSAEEVLLLVPQEWDLEVPVYQKVLKEGLVEVLRYFAKSYLPKRTQYWAQYHQIKINRVYIKHVKTRWGSCSNKGNINLSIHLMLLPKAWIDYVICHELAHIAHPNHSAAFWNHLEELLPGAKKIDKALNKYSRPF